MWNTGNISSHWSQWAAFQPASYQNFSHDEVDWAALAQQWIQMKELHDVVLSPQPTHFVSNLNVSQPYGLFQTDLPEVGLGIQTIDSLRNKNQDVTQWNYWQQWPPNNWNRSLFSLSQSCSVQHVPELKPALGGENLSVSHAKESSHISTIPRSFEYNHGNVPLVQPDMASVPFIRSLGRTEMRIRDSDVKDFVIEKPEGNEEVTIDATKRRHLPAWIREGLEKMEKEKQKKAEKEKLIRDQEKKHHLGFSVHSFPLSINESDNSETKRTNDFQQQDSDSDDSPVHIFSKHTESDSQMKAKPLSTVKETIFEIIDSFNQEDLLREAMLIVRRALTEILMEVTTEEMVRIANEIHRAKYGPALQLTKQGAISSLSGSVGLVSYASGSEGDEDESDYSSINPLDIKQSGQQKENKYTPLFLSNDPVLCKGNNSKEDIKDEQIVKQEAITAENKEYTEMNLLNTNKTCDNEKYKKIEEKLDKSKTELEKPYKLTGEVKKNRNSETKKEFNKICKDKSHNIQDKKKLSDSNKSVRKIESVSSFKKKDENVRKEESTKLAKKHEEPKDKLEKKRSLKSHLGKKEKELEDKRHRKKQRKHSVDSSSSEYDKILVHSDLSKGYSKHRKRESSRDKKKERTKHTTPERKSRKDSHSISKHSYRNTDKFRSHKSQWRHESSSSVNSTSSSSLSCYSRKHQR